MIPIQLETKMNKLETRYAGELATLKQAGEIIDYVFEPMGLKLAPKTYYHPDFLVVYPDRFEFHEVKGFCRDDALVKIKVAAKMFPWFKFKIIFWSKRNWTIRKITG